jgi:hypothetical protein
MGMVEFAFRLAINALFFVWALQLICFGWELKAFLPKTSARTP